MFLLILLLKMKVTWNVIAAKLLNMDNTIKYLYNQYGENAILHKRESPFAENDLMVKTISNNLSVKKFTPNKRGYFIVEYFEPQSYRLDFNLVAETVSVKNGNDYSEVALYGFSYKNNVFSFNFLSGENLFFEETRNAIKTFFDVKQGFKWIEK